MKPFFLSISVWLAFVSLSEAQTKPADETAAVPAKATAKITIPDWPQTPEAVESMVKDAIANANKALDAIGAQDLKTATFKSTFVALDDLSYEAGLAANKASVIKETNK